MPDARIIAIQAGIAAKRPDLAAKVQTGAKGQLVLFPGHMGRTMAHAWRYAGQTRIGETVYYCAQCGLMKLLRRDGSEIFGLSSEMTEEPRCKGAA